MENSNCPRCNAEFAVGTKFCQHCGYHLEPGGQTFSSHGYPDHKYLKASLGSRFLASLLDGLITTGFAIPAIVFYVIGILKIEGFEKKVAIPFLVVAGILYLLPLTYSFIKDGIGKGQSWGKKATNLMVIHLPDNQPCSFSQSILRNFILALLGVIPFVGWLIEPVIVLASDDGRRLGDKAANTQVIEIKYFNN